MPVATPRPARPALPTTLVTGRRAADRERAIAAVIDGPDTTVILEGLADPTSPLVDHTALADPPAIVRIAPGCLCCAGNLVLRVTLNRLLRRPPARLFISLADATHVGQLRAFLSAPPYDSLLSLCDDITA
ncbi:GTPase [Pseudoduganella chitinolytica]|uniref:GTPase n=1 Tax=Pseudoduganella chitinolytica TaxID=34070 RepID=A0ABY8B5E4_9BURK|nr:GTPase [Pseudoduganella chitinolytica]WEF31100.1 GTPase [Pseudoduganella chitinolytica]